MEFTHNTRFSRARTRITCVFESGSPDQSWPKQMMSRPRSPQEETSTVFGGDVSVATIDSKASMSVIYRKMTWQFCDETSAFVRRRDAQSIFKHWRSRRATPSGEIPRLNRHPREAAKKVST